MAQKRSRIIYPSQSVWANGNVLYRVQAFGSTTTFTSEDLFELGQLNTIDVVDDVPAVAVTIETNCFGDLYTLAYLANVNTTGFDATATSAANLVVNSGTTAIRYYHGVTMADFAAVCEGASVDIWSPVQNECDLGTDTDNIDLSMFLGNVFINRIEWAFTAGANATENYTGETDNKAWYLNDASHISQEEWVFGVNTGVGEGVSGGTGNEIVNSTTTFGLSLTSGTEQVATLSDGTLGFLRTDDFGRRAVRYWNDSESAYSDFPIIAGSSSDADSWVYNSATNEVYMPTNFTNSGSDPQYAIGEAVADSDRLIIIYAANDYADNAVAPTAQATRLNSEYFAPINGAAGGSSATTRVEDVGALRQGQIEAYLVDADNSTSYQRALRVTGVTIAADLTRTPLNELGTLLPYDRPVTLPIPFTVTVDTTFSDLEHFAILSGKKSEFDADTLNDVDIYDLMAKDNMSLVVKLYQQTDQDAGGTAENRNVLSSDMVGDEYFYVASPGSPGTNSTKGTYSLNDREYPLETIIAKNLRVTDEAYTLRLGDNATQTFGYRGNNEIYVVRGEVWFDDLLQTPGIERNA